MRVRDSERERERERESGNWAGQVVRILYFPQNEWKETRLVEEVCHIALGEFQDRNEVQNKLIKLKFLQKNNSEGQ